MFGKYDILEGLSFPNFLERIAGHLRTPIKSKRKTPFCTKKHHRLETSNIGQSVSDTDEKLTSNSFQRRMRSTVRTFCTCIIIISARLFLHRPTNQRSQACARKEGKFVLLNGGVNVCEKHVVTTFASALSCSNFCSQSIANVFL